jgi:Major tropism determinant N-terminal domain
MPFQLRRGTDSQRLTITPAQGELIFTTDTKEIYVGDGTTLGGNAITGTFAGGNLTSDLQISSYSVTNNSNLTISGSTGTITAVSFTGAINPTNNINLGLSNINNANNLVIDGSTGNITANSVSFNGKITVDPNGYILSSLPNGVNYGDPAVYFGKPSQTVGTIHYTGRVQNVYFSTVGMEGGIGHSYQQHYVSRGSITSPDPLLANDLIGTNRLYAYDGSDYKFYSLYGGYVDSVVEGDVTGGFTILNFDPSYNIASQLTFNTNGILSAPVIQSGSFNGSSNYPSSPAAGMIIFDSSNSHFYGYDGTTWKQLDN